MRRWSIVIVVYFCSVVACLNQYKVPPATGLLMQYFHVDTVMVGWMMSIFSLTGIILAFPAAVILRGFGAVKSGLSAMGCIILGCVIGAIATTSSIIMTGRVVEGIGLSLIAVISPAVIAMYFKHDEIGLPMGIWATWYPVGSTLGYRITHPVTDAFGGWSGIWWVGAALAAAGFILYALIVRQPRDGEGSHGHGASGVPFKEGIKNFQIWMLGLAFFFMMMGSLGFLTWTPHYLHEAFELPQKVANNYASFGFMLSAPGGIIAGIVISKLMSKRNAIIVTLAVLSALIYPFAFIVPQSVIVLFLSTVGFVTGFLCATVFAVVPKVMGSYSLAGLGMGVIIFMQSWANLLATPVMGYIIGDGHYEKAVVPTAIVQILGLVAAIAFAKGKATSSPETHPSH